MNWRSQRSGIAGVFLALCLLPAAASGDDLPPLLREAVKTGDLDTAEQLWRHAGHPDPTPLLFLAREPRVLNWLIDNGADPSGIDSYANSALMRAITRTGRCDVVNALLNAGADPGYHTPGGRSALHDTARLGQQRATRSLLTFGADPLARDRRGRTPLHHAITEQNIYVLQNLLQSLNGKLPDALHIELDELARDTRDANVIGAVERFQRGGPPAVGDPADGRTLKRYVEKDRLGDLGRLLDEGMHPDSRAAGYATALMVASEQGNLDAMRILIEAGADVNTRNGTGQAPLHWATPNIAAMRLLLEHGAEANPVSDQGFTPIGGLVYGNSNPENRNRAVELLIRYGVDVDDKIAEDAYPIIAAAESRNPAMIELLLDQDAGDRTTCDGRSALTISTRYEDLASIRVLTGDAGVIGHTLAQNEALREELLELATDENDPVLLDNVHQGNLLANDGGRDLDRLLMKALERGNNEAANRLIESGADPNMRDAEGRTALQIAIERERSTMVRNLLKRGADPNAKGAAGKLPLELSIEQRSTAITMLLLDEGADPGAPASNGKSLLMHAILSTANHNVVMLMATDRRVDPAFQDDRGYTVLHHAITGDRPAILRQLLNAGGDPGLGPALLHTAVRYEKPGMARVLLAHGLDLDGRDERGFTPLAYAVRGRSITMVRFLVEQGADVRLPARIHPDAGRQTALLPLAYDRYDRSILVSLIANGADLNGRDRSNGTVLHFAVGLKDFELVTTLLASGANPTLKDDLNRTPADLARSREWTAGAEVIERAIALRE